MPGIILKQLLLNLREHQNHLVDDYSYLCPMSRVSDSGAVEWSLRICIFKNVPREHCGQQGTLRSTVLEDVYILTPTCIRMPKGRYSFSHFAGDKTEAQRS